ncbi:MAG: DUF4350 domain-containing protein [Odoribacter sp.]|nr:DUF4350 domain-containing protein [Odoribacter sp.]
MRLKYVLFIVTLIALSVFYTWFEASRPKPVDWSETYARRDKIPYGTYVVSRSLEELFPEAEVRFSTSSLYEELVGMADEKGTVYMVVGRFFRPDRVELGRLLDWVEQGNYVFASAWWMADTLLGVLSLETEMDFKSLPVYLRAPAGDGKGYNLKRQSAYYFVPGEEFGGTVLGWKEEEGKPDFVALSRGAGWLFLNLNPEAFTNYHALDSLNGDYFYRALSWVPADCRKVVWADSRDGGWNGLPEDGEMRNNRVRTPFEVILMYPALRLALYLLLAGMLLYGIFRAKREQRAMAVVTPPRDRMTEFVATVSALYLKEKDHGAIAVKLVDFFLSEVRIRYGVRTDVLDEGFARLLAEHAEADGEGTLALVRLMRQVRETARADEALLRRLTAGMEEFMSSKE